MIKRVKQKEQEKPVQKKPETKTKKEKAPIQVEPKKQPEAEKKPEVIASPVPVTQESETHAEVKKKYFGIGLVGSHEELDKFRGLIKMRKKVIGNEIISMIKEWNEKNKF